MTLHKISSSRPLLARKGSAIPAAKARGEGAGAGAEARPPTADDTEGEAPRFSLVSPEPTSANGVDAGGDSSASEPPPPASLLPFSLHRGRGGAGALVPDDPHEAYVDPVILARGAPDAPPKAAEDLSPASDDDGDVAATPDIQTAEGREPSISTSATSAAPLAAPEREIEAAYAPSIHYRKAGEERWLMAIVVAIVVIGAVAWWALRSGPPALDETAGPQATSAAPPVAEKMPAPEGTAVDETAAPPTAAASVAPSVDVVRIDPGGATVIAGRAAPGSELIVLDRGTPLGTVKADAFGEWVFLPTEPLPAGEHEFGLVVKSVQGTVVMPAPAASEAQAPDEPVSLAPVPPKPRVPPQERLLEIGPGADEPAPLPPRKPAEVPGKAR